MAAESKEIFVEFFNGFLLENIVYSPSLIKFTYGDVLFFGCQCSGVSGTSSSKRGQEYMYVGCVYVSK